MAWVYSSSCQASRPRGCWSGQTGSGCVLAEALSFVSTRVVLGLVFFLAVTPTGVVKRLTGWDPLGRRRSRRESYWVPYPERQRDPKHFEKMF